MKTAVSLTVCALLLAGSAVLAADRKPVPLQKPGLEPRASQPATRPGLPGTAAKPDVTSGAFPDKKKGIIIGGAVGGTGGKFVPWGGSADLSDVAALPGTIVQGRCAFNATYVEANIGAALTTPPYTNRLKLDGAEAAVNSNRALNAGQSKTVTTQPYLSLGGHGLQLSLDDGNVVAEPDETNNVFSIRYTLKQCRSACDGLPDLVPVVPKKMGGTWKVKNIGNCPAPASKLTVDCRKEGHTGGGGGCTDVPPPCAGQNVDPALPDKFVVAVKALDPGETFTYTFSCWRQMQWPPGTYKFSFMADAPLAVTESNERNNTATSSLTSP